MKWEHDVYVLNLFIVLSDLPYYNTQWTNMCHCEKNDKLKRLQNNSDNSQLHLIQLNQTLTISVGCRVVVRWMAEVDHFYC
ncbi:hypothetical protein T03_1538 [Trichinella britovi]|uniref:Uncharacterized protein n=2 Tax=Trichinella TaxID=6333 RepID=A0A0V1D579_TRIBR|nr:hypothetical protein T05_3897 [Trichinella murrelli]KRY56498.1 hypothetical protein T03_1538 [Trichinella britovi]